MRKLLYTLAACLCTITAASPTLLADEREDYDFIAGVLQFVLERQAEELRNHRVKYRVWDMLCFDLRDVDCTGIPVPTVLLFEPNPLRPGLAGYYNGDDVVYIRSNLRGDAREEVLAHEFSHYIDSVLGLLPPLPVFNGDKEGIFGLCMSEKRAWAVSDRYNYLNFHRSKIVGKSWTRWYSHCTPFKDRLYPEA